MNNTTRKQLMNLFMQQVWNEGSFSRLSDMVTPDYNVSQDDYDPWSGQVINHQKPPSVTCLDTSLCPIDSSNTGPDPSFANLSSAL
jgi:hypothetical protein